MIFFVFLWFCSSLSDAQRERHFLHYKFTALTRADTFPEFSAEVVYDDRRISHYSNEERVWIGTEDWTEAPADPPDSRKWFTRQIRTLSNCTDSQCSELHVLQRIIGCELEKLPDGSVDLTVFDEYGFDGEDLISFNSDTMQWIEKSPKAKRTKEQWDSQTGRNHVIKLYLKTCTDWISTFINTKKTPPDVHVSVSEAPDEENKLVLTCLATGFYPRDVQMDIRRNEFILEGQTSSGIRPNADGSFQMRISVKIDTNHNGIYECLLNHSHLTLSRAVLTLYDVRSFDGESESSCPVIAGITAAVDLVLVLIVIIYCIYKKILSSDLMRIVKRRSD